VVSGKEGVVKVKLPEIPIFPAESSDLIRKLYVVLEERLEMVIEWFVTKVLDLGEDEP
jgi:hypothetical protein